MFLEDMLFCWRLVESPHARPILERLQKMYFIQHNKIFHNCAHLNLVLDQIILYYIYIGNLALCSLKDRLCQRTRNSGLFSHVCLYPTLVQSITRAQEYFSLLFPNQNCCSQGFEKWQALDSYHYTRAFDLKT